MSALFAFLQNPDVLTAVGYILGAAVTFILAKWGQAFLAKNNLDKLYNLTHDMVMQVYVEYVRDLKAASEDGTLTPEEKKIALDRAVALIKANAKSYGVDVAKTYLPAVVEYVLRKIKGEAATGVTVKN